MKTKKILSWIWLILLVGFFTPYSPDPIPTISTKDWIENSITRWKLMRKNNLIQGTLLITQSNQLIFSDGKSDQQYSIGSLSKSFVGYYFYTHPDLKDKKVCDYFQTFCQNNLNHVTVGDLLKHRSNISKKSELSQMLMYSFALQTELSKLDSVQISAENRQPKNPRFRYSNLGYLFLSRIIEIQEKRSFADAMQAIFNKVGLSQTTVANPNKAPTTVVLIPWTAIQFKMPFINQAAHSFGAGGIISTALDLQKWFRFLNSENVHESAKKNVDHYDLGLIHTENNLGKMFWHNGAVLGFYSLNIQTNENLQFTLLTNHLKPFEFLQSCLGPFESFYKNENTKTNNNNPTKEKK